jgi:hypothetical protein
MGEMDLLEAGWRWQRWTYRELDDREQAGDGRRVWGLAAIIPRNILECCVLHITM